MTKAVLVMPAAEPLTARIAKVIHGEAELDLVVASSRSDDLGDILEDAEILFSFATPAEALRRAQRLRWIQALGSGTDGFGDLGLLEPGIIVTNAAGIHGVPVSEAALSAMFSMARRLPDAYRLQAEHIWGSWDPVLLSGSTCLIIGLGHIASVLAPRCAALGMRVEGVSRVPREVENFSRIWPRNELLTAVAGADFIVLLAALDDTTRGMIDETMLRAAKPGAFLINVGRGGLIDHDALRRVLAEGRLGGAALDAFPLEPLPVGDPIWDSPSIAVTPHLGGRHDRYEEMLRPILAHNLRSYFAGKSGDMINRVRGPGH